MGKFRIEYDRNSCIGAGVCVAVAPDHWKMGDDGKANLVGGAKGADGKMTKEIDEKDLSVNKQAAEGCPAIVIKVFEGSKQVAP